MTPVRTIGFVSGIVLFLAIQFSPTFDTFHAAAASLVAKEGAAVDPGFLAASMQSVFAMLVLMVAWWFTEAVPLPVTALLPAVLLPMLKVSGVSGGEAYPFAPQNVLRHYAAPVIFLFLGGFLLAAAMQKWRLDRRFTLWFLTRGSIAGDSRKILLGIMCATAFVSMWISNTAAAAMMIPIGLGLLAMFEAEPGKSRYGTAVMLGIAYAASIGGVGTIIGTPPNGIALGILDSTFGADPSYEPITFLGWMSFGVPYVVLMVPAAWLLLLKRYPPEVIRVTGERERLVDEYRRLGPITGAEKGTLGVLLLAVLLWVTNPFWVAILPGPVAGRLAWVDEYSIGLICGVLLFLVPAGKGSGGFLLGWEDTKFVDWGTLILFGGGIALSDAMFRSGLASWIVEPAVRLFGEPSPLVLLLVAVLAIDFLTEVTSNTAVTSMIVPVLIGVSVQSGINPVMIAVGAAVASSMAFMLPVATPPNALIYGTGRIPLREMIRAGFLLDILGWALTTGIIYLLAHKLFGIF
jgi:sodium-dependent dicarboxylate transporter 2/3/5